MADYENRLFEALIDSARRETAPGATASATIANALATKRVAEALERANIIQYAALRLAHGEHADGYMKVLETSS